MNWKQKIAMVLYCAVVYPICLVAFGIFVYSMLSMIHWDRVAVLVGVLVMAGWWWLCVKGEKP